MFYPWGSNKQYVVIKYVKPIKTSRQSKHRKNVCEFILKILFVMFLDVVLNQNYIHLLVTPWAKILQTRKRCSCSSLNTDLFKVSLSEHVFVEINVKTSITSFSNILIIMPSVLDPDDTVCQWRDLIDIIFSTTFTHIHQVLYISCFSISDLHQITGIQI